MKTLASLAALLLLAACTTTEVQPVGSAKADLKEAARLNAQLGIDYMRKGEFEAALEKLTKALDQDSDLAVAHSAIALVYQRRGEKDDAEKHFRKALRLNEDDATTLNNFGIFLCGQGEYEDAEEIFLKAAKNKDNATPADAWANAGTCVRHDPKGLDRAENYLREALKINPKHANALAQLAQLSYDRKEYLKARAFLQRYEVVARPTAETLWLAVQNERALGDMTAARSYERRLRQEFPESQQTDEMMSKPPAKK